MTNNWVDNISSGMLFGLMVGGAILAVGFATAFTVILIKYRRMKKKYCPKDPTVKGPTKPGKRGWLS